MTSPPGYAPITEPSAGVTSRVRESDLTFEEWCIVHRFEPGSKSAQKAFLMDGLGLTGCQAKELLRAYALDQRDRQARQASAEEFGDWLRSNWPSLSLATFGATRRPPSDPHRWRTHT